MKRKIGFAWALLPFFLLLVLIGCAPATHKTTTQARVFSILYNDTNTAPLREDWLILDQYRQQRNVTFSFRLGDDSDYGKALVHAFESGDIPDIVLKVWPANIESYANIGLLLAFSDYIDRMPYFQAYIASHGLEADLDRLRFPNGKFYILPGFQRRIQVQQWIYRRDLFLKHGLPAPQTYDELFDSLVVLKGLYPSSIPITGAWGGAHLFAMMGAGYGISAGWNGTICYDAPTDRWIFAPASENQKAMLVFLNRCYSAGILDPAIFMQRDVDFTNKMQDGRMILGVSWITSGFASWNKMLAEHGIPDGQWAPLPVLESTIGIRAVPPVDSFKKGLVSPARVATEPYFNDLLAFLDWAVYSDEGRQLTTWGVEGKTFTNNPDGKQFAPDIKTPHNPDAKLELKRDFGLDSMFNLTENEEYEDFKKPASIVTFLQESLDAGHTAELSPVLKLSPGAIDVVAKISEKLNPYVTEAIRMFITGELSLSQDWDAYIVELGNRGYKSIETVYNSAWANQH
jgi:putative aldouronate transport system substrate-binding protein